MNDKRSKKELEELGRMMASIYDIGYGSRREFYKMSFIRGVITGFGTVIGATILVALMLWVLGFFDQVPLIEKVINTTTQGVQSTN